MGKNLGKLSSAILLAGLTAAELPRLADKLIWHPAMPKVIKGKRYIACVGDSITFGAGVRAHYKTQSYPAYLQKEVGDTYQVLNYGLSGRTLVSNGDMPYTREKQYIETFHHKMDMVICMLGTNDSKPYNWDADLYRVELISFLKKYQNANLNGRVVAMTPPKAFKVKGQDAVVYDILDENIQTAVEIVKDVVVQMNQESADHAEIQLMDMYAFTESHPEWFPDGVHPNAVGNKAIAEYIGERIRPLL